MPNYATDADIRRLKAKGERPELISLSRRDEVPHGGATLCVRVYPTGEKSWIARFRRQSLPSLLAFGRFSQGEPDHMSLQLARQIHAAFNQAVIAGSPTREQLLGIAQDFRASHARVQSLVVHAQQAAAAACESAPRAQEVPVLQERAVLERSRARPKASPSAVPVSAPEAAENQLADEPSLAVAPEPEPAPQDPSPVPAVWAPTLKEIFEQYLEALASRGSMTTVRDYKSAFKRHVEVPHPALAEKPAHEVTSEEMADLIYGVYVRPSRKRGIDQALALERADSQQYDGRTNKFDPNRSGETKNQKREAERLRSMLRTAYNNHIESKTKSTVPRERRRKSLVQVNPLQHITAIPGAIQARRRSLTSLELGFFMLCLDLVPSATSRALQLVVWLGGQRLAQVLRATTEDLDEDCESLMLWDPKGKRTQARAHLVPLVGPAKDLIKIGESHAKERDTPYLFTTSGSKLLSTDAVSDLLLSIKLEMLTRGVIKKDFDVRDIRRTFVTYLASKKLDGKASAHLFSHGLGGVQDEHYNLYEYFTEKQEALHILHAYVHDAIAKARYELGSRLPDSINLKVNGPCKGLVGLGTED